MKELLSRIAHSLKLEAPGGAGSGGMGGGGGAGAGQGGQPGAGGQQTGGQPQGQPAAHKFDPNGTYDFGDGKPIKGSEYMARYMPKDQYDKGVEFLTSVAKQLDEAKRGGRQPQQPRQPQQQQQPPTDPFGHVWEQPLIDGATLKELYHKGYGALANAIQQQQQTIQKLQGQLKNVGTHVGTLAEKTSGEEYNAMLDGAITGLGLPGFDPQHEALKPLMPFVREFAQDVFDSHDPNDKNYAKEMPGIFKSRIENMIKFVRALDKVRLDTQKRQPFKFIKPTANAQPGQQSQYKFESPAVLARRVHAMANAANNPDAT